MSSTATTTRTIQYTPPEAPVNSGTATITTSTTYNSQNVGDIDVQISDGPGTLFSIPFGSIDSAKIAIIKNSLGSEIGIRINGSATDNVKLPSGGTFSFESPTAPTATPLTAIEIATTAAPTQISRVSYWVFGD